jgi:hypothetical protein
VRARRRRGRRDGRRAGAADRHRRDAPAAPRERGAHGRGAADGRGAPRGARGDAAVNIIPIVFDRRGIDLAIIVVTIIVIVIVIVIIVIIIFGRRGIGFGPSAG